METHVQSDLPMHQSIFTDTAVAVLLAATCLTFFAYQYIPSQLDRLRRVTEDTQPRGNIMRLVTDDAFTYFIRVCGVDHLIIATVMFMNYHGKLGGEPAWGWLIVGSEIAVAAVSVIAALSLRLEISRLKGNP